MCTSKKLNNDVFDDQVIEETSNQATLTRRRNNDQMVENVLLIWLDNNIDMDTVDCQNTINKLQRVVHSIKTFTNGEKCIQFLKTIENEKTCMVISSTLAQDIVPQLHHLSQVDTIFIFCDEKGWYEQWTKNWLKIKGMSTDIDSICDALKQVAQQCEQNSISISFIETTGDMMNKNLNQLEPSFMYTQIMKEILLTITFEEKHFQQFIDYCLEISTDNPNRLQKVNKIKEEYRRETPVWWYTYESFLYPMLNRALRTLHSDLIITLGFFIKDLHLQIEQLHKEQFGSPACDKNFIVYRGQGLAKEEFEKMRTTKGGLLAFNCFLSTSKNYDVSLAFAESAAADPDLVGILFVMTIDPSQSTTPFAAIDEVSYYKDQEEEVLFLMHTVFRINDITPMDKNQRLFQVDLTLTNDNDPDLRVLTDKIREETFPNSKGWYRLGLTLLKMGQSKEAEEVYQILLEQATTEREKAPIYHHIGWAKWIQGDYQAAIMWYEKSLSIQQQSLLPNDIHLAMSYNNVGIVCQNMGEYSKALSSHEKALAIQQQSLPPNHPSLAMSYNNIGLVYNNMGEYSKALSSHEKALAIGQQSLPPNHPDLAPSYNNIGIVYDEMGEYSKALSSHEKALAIGQQSLPSNHPGLAMPFNNIGNVYFKMGEYSKALSSHEKALAIRQQSLPLNHPDLAMSYNNIGEVQLHLGESSTALSLLEKTLTIIEKTLPLNHPTFFDPCKNIGMVHEKLGDYSKAYSFYQRAVDVGQRSLPRNHAELQKCQENLARIKDKV